MRKDLSIITILILLIVVGGVFYQNFNARPTEPLVRGLRLGESKVYNGVRVTPIAVVEDSRCQEGVQCIWAGTVKVQTQISSGLGTTNQVLEINKPLTTEAEEVTLISVGPKEDYTFEYLVTKRSSVTPTPTMPGPSPSPTPGASGGCYVGGCSAQLCSDEPNLVSTCEWSEAYACYKTSKCERQSNGQCGWTETPELRMCLNNAKNGTIYRAPAEAL